VVGRLENLPDLVEQIDGGPAILIIGDVVAHSAPWRHSKSDEQSYLNEVISNLLEAAE
jgi:uroporphyrin-III C-methyltransferase/precorrin-2 dehydrogenase/sirohydrochlorin ferrochelatase